jgi:hypothetical protein
MTISEIVEQAWQLDHSRQQAAAEAIQAAMASSRPQLAPHDTATATSGAYRTVWELAA